MPIYEYTCAKCRKLTDVLQKVSDPPPGRCSHCGAKGKLTRVVSRTSFVLRGGGWYADLYSSKKPEPASSKAAATGEGKGEEKSEPSAATGSKSSETSAKDESSSKGAGSSGSKAGSPSKKPKKAV